jgi:predicted DCC family thiol-disulfide oxidoreductase YuxK
VVLFDGVCNLCNGFVRFVIRRDRQARFKFGSLQSRGAKELLSRRSNSAAIPDSVVLWENGTVYTESSAALRIARMLGFPWSLAYALVIVPKKLRDAIYSLVARNRYRWFGKRDVCMIPTPDLRDRFLPD